MTDRAGGSCGFLIVFFLLFLLLIMPDVVSAQDLDYDPYLPTLRDEKGAQQGAVRRREFVEKVSNIAALPLDILKAGIHKTLVEIEEHRFEKKVEWFYEDILLEHGLKPRLSNVAGFSNPGGGGEIDLMKLARLDEEVPMFRLEGGGQWVGGKIGLVEGTTKWQLFEPGPTLGGNFSYVYRPEEDFYGIGPNTSLGDGTTFEEETTLLEGSVGYSFSDHVGASAHFNYKNVNIAQGHEKGKGAIQVIFPSGTVAGLGGGEFISVGSEIWYDTRDSEDDPTRGGFRKLSVGFHEGMENFGFTYFKYRGEIVHYFPLLSEKRNLAIRLLAEHNDEVNQRPIPFFDGARLGGFGTGPAVGDTHRGFIVNRFFGESEFLLSLEYRYKIYEYREWNAWAVIFWDEGQVFNEWSEFQFKDFRESIGLGIRIKFAHKPILAVEVAHSDEGFEFYVRTKTPF